jgi:hypothetical protein
VTSLTRDGSERPERFMLLWQNLASTAAAFYVIKYR